MERRSWRYGILAGALLLIPAGVFWRTASLRPVHQVFPLPFVHAAGLTLKNGLLFSADPQRQILFTLSSQDGRVLSVEKFYNPSLSGLAWGGDCFWSTNAEQGRIYRHNLDPEHTIRRTYANPDHSPTAIFWNGPDLWVGDPRVQSVLRYKIGATLVLSRQYPLPGMNPAGLFFSGNTLWVLDSVTRKICRYRLGGLLTGLDSLDLSEWLPAAARTTGLAVTSSDLWWITENPAQLHHLDIRRSSDIWKPF